MTGSSRTANSIRNSIWGWISKIIAMVLPFVLRTVMIYTIGQSYVGLNSLFASILSVLSLSELGVGTAIVYSMYKPLADGNDDEVCALLNLYRKLYNYIGMAVLVIGLALLPFLPHFVKGNLPDDINLYTLYLIYLAEAVISYCFFAYYSSLLTANQRNDILSKTQIVLSIVKYLFQIIVLLIWKNYYLYIIFLPLYNLAFNGLNAIIAHKMYPNYICRGKIEKENLQEIKKRVVGLMIHKFGTTTRNSLDSIIISSLLGLVVVAKYNNYYFIMLTVLSFFGALLQGIQASVGNSVAVESVDKNFQDLKRFQFLYVWVGGLCTALLLCLYQPFMLVWVRDQEMLMTFPEVISWCLYFYLLLQGDLISIYNNAAGLWYYGKTRYILEAICNLVLNLVLGKLLGTFGVILATILTIFVFSTIYGSFIVFKHYFGSEKIGEYFKQLSQYFLAMVLTITISYLICSLFPMTMNLAKGILFITIRAVICATVYTVLYTLMLHKMPEYHASKDFLNRNIFRFIHGGVK